MNENLIGLDKKVENKKIHSFFMNLALEEAKKAFKMGEVPVGAVITREDKLLSQAHNIREKNNNPTGHAELLVIQKVSEKLDSWRLEGCKLYVSLEPCLMCIGAILQARLSDLFYACPDLKDGFSSSYCLTQNKHWTHEIKIHTEIKSQESSLLLKTFFKELRKKEPYNS